MARDYMSYIKELLENTGEILPIDTGKAIKIHKDQAIKLIVFDIYGTLLISDSGDVDEASLSVENLKVSLENSGFQIVDTEKLDLMLQLFPKTVKYHQKNLKNCGIPHPEVDFTEVWRDIFEECEATGIIKITKTSDLKSFTFIFELLSNKVYPMPGMKKMLEKLNEKMRAPGIISNAQFFTPIIMNFFLTGEYTEKEYIEYFDQELSVFSYKSLRAKPDVELFRELARKIQIIHGFEPEEVLFVGNDMLKDIYTAKSAGFKAALFAGDKRSLRLRTDREEVKQIQPDFIINHLEQVLQITGL